MSTEKNGQCAIGPSQFLLFCFSEDKIYILLILGISYIIYFLGTHPTQTATVLIYIYLCVVLGLRGGRGRLYYTVYLSLHCVTTDQNHSCNDDGQR